jgi:hypothetical protein
MLGTPLANLSRPQTAAATGLPGSIVVRSYAGHRWFEEFMTKTQVSPDGSYLLRTTLEGVQTLSRMSDGVTLDGRLRGGLSSFERAVFCGRTLLRLGVRDRVHGWFVGDAPALTRVTIPADATPICSQDGSAIAFYQSTPENIVGPSTISSLSLALHKRTDARLAGPVTGAVVSPNGRRVYALVRQRDGASSLVRVSAADGAVTTLAMNLDAPPYPLLFPGVVLAVTNDERTLVLPLVSRRPPDDAARQNADVKRWTKVYAFDLRARKLHLIDAAAHDESDPAIVGNALYFVRTVVTKSIVAFPAGGGRLHEVAADAFLPSFTRDRKRLAFDFGDLRRADFGLDIRAEAVAIDGNADAISRPSIVAASNHEHFTPEWSPNMKWIAYHSHRAPKPPPYYDAAGTTDDIWLRLADDRSAPERRVTSFGLEVGTVYWSPDGRKLLFGSLDRSAPTVYHAWTTTLDPVTGRVVRNARLPFPGIVSPVWSIWSPDGRSIAVEDARSSTKQALWVASSDGRRTRRIHDFDSETYGGVDWSPDGKTLVFSALTNGRMQIFSISSSGGAATQLTHDALNVMHPRVSADGRWIASTRMEVRQELRRASAGI